jgi:Flp pilus assembly protein TadG
MIEMALVILMLLILTFGIADVGLYMFRFVQATNCTREVARRAAVREDNPTAAPFCASGDLRGAVTIAYDPDDSPGSDVTASLNVTHNWIAISYLIPGMEDTIAIRAATTMRMEGEFET